MLLKIKIGYVKEWKVILDALHDRYEETRIIFNPKNVIFRCVDPKNISMIDISFPVWAFDIFNRNPGIFGLKVVEFRESLKRFSNNNPVYIEAQDSNTLQIMINGDKQIDVKTWKVENQKENQPPDVKYTAKITLDSEAMIRIFSSIGDKSKYVTINCFNDRVQFCGQGDDQKYMVDLERGKSPELFEVNSINETSSNYLLEYLTNIIREVGKESHRVNMEYAASTPMRMSFDMPSLAKVDLYLAPRIEH